MREAQLIQTSLVPLKAMHEETVEISFRFRPFSEVSGDFADFFRLPDGLIGIYMGDVAGKGLSAAMYGALVMGTLRGIHKSGTETASVLTVLNERLMQRPLHGRFCCTLYAVFNPVTRELAFSNAGLPLPLLISKNTCQALGEGGLPPGMFPSAAYVQHRVQLSPGDSVLFATDGLHESSNGFEFFAERIAESWKHCPHSSADQSLNFLFESLHAFSNGNKPDDDVTVVVLKVPG
jgi:sigma-B regulation protein RsbU (phosphoserine phosphatase)